MISRKFKETLDWLLGERKPKPESTVTPVVPTDAAAIMKAAEGDGPYAQVLDRKPYTPAIPHIVTMEASDDVRIEVQMALSQDHIAGAPPYVRKWFCKLTVASNDRIGFYSTYRSLKETAPTFLKWLEVWLGRNTFRVEDPDIVDNDRGGWAVSDAGRGVLEEVCPRITLKKNGREITSELVYIFAGMQV
jgi:hypothetical protein